MIRGPNFPERNFAVRSAPALHGGRLADGQIRQRLQFRQKTLILRHRPKLGVCVYHWSTDLWVIPNLIRRAYPFYNLYLDHHSLHNEETVLYARAR